MRRAASGAARRIGDLLFAALGEADGERRARMVEQLCHPHLVVIANGREWTGTAGFHRASLSFRDLCANELPVAGHPARASRRLLAFKWHLDRAQRSGTLLVEIREARIAAIYLRASACNAAAARPGGIDDGR